jgi:hypothetical protein
MKLSLILILCSAIQSTCMPPMHTGLEYKNWHDCMIAGYTQSKEFLETSGPDQVNENQIYVKFVCLETIEEENT